MSLQQSYIALDWVKDALDETLQKALEQLQEQTPFSMQAAYESLHQVSGTLHIAQLADVLMLSEVLEKVVQAISVGRLHYSNVQTQIRRVIEVLIEELDHLQRTKTSRTALVYEQVDVLNALLLNEVAEPKISFVPDYSLLDEKFSAPVQPSQKDKLIQAYRFFLAAWLNDNSSAQALLDLTRVADLLHAVAQTRQDFALWQVARVFQRSVVNGHLTDVTVIRPMLIRLERSLATKDQANIDSQNILLGDLLSELDPQHVADPEASQVRQFYGMDLPEGLNVSSRLLDSALQQVNTARSTVAVNRDTAAIALREAVRLLNVSGWHPLAKEGQSKLQQLVSDYREDSDFIEQFSSDLNQFAEKVKQTILLTSKSDQVAESGLVQDALHAAVRESRAALEKIKSALAKYHQTRGDVSALVTVPDLLQMVSGVFTMIELPRAATLLSNTKSAMKSTVLKNNYVPHWKQTDLLAQLISSIEYYLDQLAGQYQDENILALAERTLVEFKKPHKESEPVPAGGEKLYHDETVDHNDVKHAEATVSATNESINKAATVVFGDESTVQSVVADNPYNDDFEQDDEIREIFIEEAEEVLETIGEFFPKWKADFADEASLKEMRRAFHTLKGSGRMVGARTVGELSWSIESLLNRVLDRSVQPNNPMIALIETVQAAIPSLIECYKEKRPNPTAMNQQIAAWVVDANALMIARVVEVVEPAAQEILVQESDEVVTPTEVSVPTEVPKKVIPANSIQTLPMHLLNEQAPKEVPEDDFESYFGEDDSILEIFLEEAQEVIQELNENFPQWAVNFENQAALKVIRRNFHTLKGSGRMVGAFALAELAWSNERLLNGVMDHTVTANQNMVQLLGDVISIFPSLVDDFSKQQAPKIQLLPIIHCAWLLQAGHDINSAQIQMVMQNAMSGNADLDDSEFPILDEEQFLLEDFDALAEAFNDESVVEPQHTVAATVADSFNSKPEMSIDELDPVLLEIFVSEAEGYLENIRTFVSENLVVGDHQVMTNDVLLRALHTLRGSAGMTGIESIYQLAHVMEHECKRLMREHVAMTDEHLDALAELDRLAVLQVNQLKSNQMPSLDDECYRYINRVEALAPKKKDADQQASEPVFTGLVTELMDIGIDNVLDAEWTLEEQLSGDSALTHVNTLNEEMIKLADAVVHVPIAPLVTLAKVLQETYQHILSYPALLDEDLGSLKDDLLAGHIALTRMFDELAASLQVQPVNTLIASLQYWQTQKPLQDVKAAIVSPKETIVQPPEAVVSEVAASQVVHSEAIKAVHLEYPVDAENDAELLEVFMEEAEELVQEIDLSFTAWTADTSNNEPLKALQRHLHTLKGGARMARVESLGDYTHELETVYERLVVNSQNTPEVLVRFLRHAQDQVAHQVEKLAHSQQSFFTPTETSTLNQYIKSRDIQVLQGYFDLIDSKRTGGIATVAEVEPLKVDLVVAPIVKQPIVSPIDEPIQELPKLGQMQVLAEAWDEGSAPDADVLEIFLDEAGEIVDLTSVQLSKWLKGSNEPNDPNTKKLLQDLQRNLHTFKGGARMAGVDSLGDLSHEMEFVYEDLALGKRPVTPEIGTLLNQSHDWLADSIAVLDRGERPQMPQPLIDALRLFRKDPSLLATAQAQSAELAVVKEGISQTLASTQPSVKPANVVEKPVASRSTTLADASGLPPMEGSFPKSHESDVSTSEMVRVSATMMEKMINLAGENAISRARIEMEISTFTLTVAEMGTAIQKISEQLRRMDGELESQIIARHHDEVSQLDGGHNQDFDPLEMDQYSSINQLSKSLAESVSDLLDFKNTLVEKARDSESLLLQQSRIQSELQEGLMSSRLVPFSRLVPRLQRVVRQTATELGKPVELNILNAEGELDRSVLERMVAPLEHMLRNAVDHGMESTVDRARTKKSEKGSITLSVLREGSEVIITLQDDGRGINVDAVRQKAIERGIIEPNAEMTDSGIMQLIFHAGLSTASQVTQISGRGVGMDVVQSEIRQLGGVVSVSSIAGQGTCFTLRLPLTVAVTDALRVRVGDRFFAVSLSQIERIVRVGQTDLENFYQSNKETYSIDGQQYRLRYLGELIGGSHTPTLYGQGQNIPAPLLLVKYEGQRFAIQVDQLIGSREEMVIKPVGVQLVTVGSISGATILGDGSVVIILDLVALARSAGSIARKRAISQAEKVTSAALVQKQTIMVVDDSVTVRKVTTRLLERNGYQVIQAKDGVDAMSKLEDAQPDLMLLDIEMPRMDGFEVATLVRHNPRLSYLPIIMITSRTGEKHRERAFSIGVDGYMGKPFQEQVLLENISDLIESKAVIARKTTV